jgi:hypothetical protein
MFSGSHGRGADASRFVPLRSAPQVGIEGPHSLEVLRLSHPSRYASREGVNDHDGLPDRIAVLYERVDLSHVEPVAGHDARFHESQALRHVVPQSS